MSSSPPPHIVASPHARALMDATNDQRPDLTYRCAGCSSGREETLLAEVYYIDGGPLFIGYHREPPQRHDNFVAEDGTTADQLLAGTDWDDEGSGWARMRWLTIFAAQIGPESVDAVVSCGRGHGETDLDTSTVLGHLRSGRAKIKVKVHR